MSNQFVSEIRMFAGTFAPLGWAFCNGQLMAISQNTALFSLLGTQFGGDGKTNFALPNLQGSMPISWGQGPGLTNRFIGDAEGSSTVTLLQSQIPNHSHTPQASTSGGTDAPTGNVWGESKLGKTPLSLYAAPGVNNVAMNPGALSAAGGNGAHNNLPPYLCVSFIIALQGVFPPRS